MNQDDRIERLAELILSIDKKQETLIHELTDQVEALEVLVEELDNRVKNLRNEG